jgi:hypothetical protein
MSTSQALDILGIQVPDAGPVFFVALALHVVAGATAVVAGIIATTARKRSGRHPRAGNVYLYAISVVFVTATVMGFRPRRHDPRCRCLVRTCHLPSTESRLRSATPPVHQRGPRRHPRGSRQKRMLHGNR